MADLSAPRHEAWRGIVALLVCRVQWVHVQGRVGGTVARILYQAQILSEVRLLLLDNATMQGPRIFHY